jgi:hypothetical protein
LVSPGGVVQGAAYVYIVGVPKLNQWGLIGDWTVVGEHASLNEKDGSIVFQFHACDLHLVLGPASDTKLIRFSVTIDSAPPGDSHGVDVNAQGFGVVTSQRLYQPMRQSGARLQDHDISHAILPMSRRTTKLSSQPIPHAPTRSRLDATLSPYAPNSHCARHAGSRLNARLRNPNRGQLPGAQADRTRREGT